MSAVRYRWAGVPCDDHCPTGVSEDCERGLRLSRVAKQAAVDGPGGIRGAARKNVLGVDTRRVDPSAGVGPGENRTAVMIGNHVGWKLAIRSVANNETIDGPGWIDDTAPQHVLGVDIRVDGVAPVCPDDNRAARTV